MEQKIRKAFGHHEIQYRLIIFYCYHRKKIHAKHSQETAIKLFLDWICNIEHHDDTDLRLAHTQPRANTARSALFPPLFPHTPLLCVAAHRILLHPEGINSWSILNGLDANSFRRLLYTYLRVCVILRTQLSHLYSLRKLCFHLLSNWMGYDRGDGFPFYFLNQMEFHLVQNWMEKCHHDHILSNLKWNRIVFSV